MQTIKIIEENFQNEKDLHRYLSKELGFPDYYGSNLDALYDCLTDICHEVRFDITRLPKNRQHRWFDSFYEVIISARKANDSIK